MAKLIPVDSFDLACKTKKHDLLNDSFKAILSNTPITRSMTQKSDVTQIAATGGYTTAGVTVSVTSLTQASGVLKWVLADLTITAAGGSIGPAAYLAIYNDTSTGDLLVGYLELGSAVTLADTQRLVIDFDGVAGALVWDPPTT